MLEIQSLSKSFDNSAVLREVTTTFKAGEISGIIGSSGSGKTVLAKCIIGLVTADSGLVNYPIEGLSVSHPADSTVPWPRIRRHVNYVSQTRSVQPYRRVLELVSEGPQFVLGQTRQEARAHAIELLKQFGVEKHADKFPTEVSGGELTRICIARSLAVKPKFIICDEIFANLDPIASNSAGDALRRAADLGVGVILISHQINFIREYGRYFLYLHNGVVWEDGNPGAQMSRPKTDELARFVALSRRV